ncbi:hypothetical protein [Serratia nevei]|uniref:hypothetical protein n=1 Tax=Serratia nevei TaxID=2703794 RepID=UPI003F7FB033
MNELYEKSSLKIENDFNDYIEELTMFIDEDEENFLNNVSLSFEIKYEEDYYACAYFDNSQINFNLYHQLNTKAQLIIIHELAHLVSYRYLNLTNHCIEFAIINYCLVRKLINHKKHYFRSYDIHEDSHYYFISINPHFFDNLINSISFFSLEDLSKKAKRIADGIRKQSIKINLGSLLNEK